MSIYLAGMTAYQAWRSKALQYWDGDNLHDLPANHRPRLNKEKVAALANELNLELPLTVAVADKNYNRTSDFFTSTYSGQHTNAHLYLKIREGVYTIRPEACLAQISRECSNLELIYRTSELCGGYALDKAGFHSRWRPSSTMAIEGFLERANGFHGREALRKAKRYAVDNSWSPMETVLALLLSLPADMGGYGLPKPELNLKVVLPSMRLAENEEEIRHPDLCWPKRKLVAEYDSAAWHESEQEKESDAMRRNKFVAAGYTVFSVTPAILFNLTSMDNLAFVLARKLKKEVPSFDEEALEKRRQLRKELFAASGLGPDDHG